MFETGLQINPDIAMLQTRVEKDYMQYLMVESSEKVTCNVMTKKEMTLKVVGQESKTF